MDEAFDLPNADHTGTHWIAARPRDPQEVLMRRKGELSKAMINRDWPHQVALPESVGAIQERGREIEAFEAASTCCTRGHSFCRHAVWHRVYCFSDRADAERFLSTFGGEWFDPKKLGKGHRWNLLKEKVMSLTYYVALPFMKSEEGIAPGEAVDSHMNLPQGCPELHQTWAPWRSSGQAIPTPATSETP